MNVSIFRIVAALFLATACIGCVCDSVGMPDLFHPGHISEQQERMKRFDPFSRSDIGPKIEGDRPSGSLNQTPTEQHLNEYRVR